MGNYSNSETLITMSTSEHSSFVSEMPEIALAKGVVDELNYSFFFLMASLLSYTSHNGKLQLVILFYYKSAPIGLRSD